jgi:hypothetical protein
VTVIYSSLNLVEGTVRTLSAYKRIYDWRDAMWIGIYGLDIETDTTPMHDSTPRGLDPATTSIVNVAVSTRDGEIVFRGDEKSLLLSLDRYIRNLPVGVVATWNGAVFDLPFILSRAKFLGIELGLTVSPAENIRPKYEPLPGHRGGYHGVWSNHTAVPHVHLDIAYALQKHATDLGIQWSLKPLARHHGLSPIEVDRTAVHLLTPEQQDEYVASDARVTRVLAERLLTSTL